jgi:hypothetical protein
MIISQDETLLQSLRELAAIAAAPPIRLAAEAALLDRMATGLCSTTFTMAVIGDQGSGKSRLLDMLLEVQRPRLPATQLLRAGETPAVLLHSGGAAPMPLLPHAFEQLVENPAAEDLVEWVFASPWLGPDVQIIDFAETDSLVSADQADYLADANAFMLVAHAARVFSQKEKALLAALLGERDPRQALIVVNNIDMVDSDDLGDVRDWVRATLQPYFTGLDGTFDATAFERRVFYVSRKDAAGIAALRDRLRIMIEDDSERSAAAHATALQMALVPAAALRRQLTEVWAELDRPQQDLAALRLMIEREHDERRQQLLDLRRETADIGDQITHKVYASLVHLLDTIHDRWDLDAPRLVQWDELGMQPLFNALFSPEQRGALRLALTRKTEEYLREQIAAWSAELPQLIAPETARLVALLRQGVDVRLEMLGDRLASTRYQSLDEQGLQTMLNTMVRRLLFGGSAIEQIVQRTLVRGLLACLMVFTGSVFLKISGIAALIVAEATGSSRQLAALRHDMLMQMRDQLLVGLREELSTPRFGATSFVRIDAFMQLLGLDGGQLPAYLRDELPAAVRGTLARSTHSSAERTAFIEQLNAVLERNTCLPIDSVLDIELSAEARYALEHSVDKAQINRLLLAEALPEHARPKVRDLLEASVAYQIGRITERTIDTLQDLKQPAETDPRLVTAQAIADASAKQQAEVAIISHRAHDLLTAASIAVYGRAFSDDELDAVVARKQALLTPKPSKIIA